MTRKLPSFVSLFLILVLPLALALSPVRSITAQARNVPGEPPDSERLPVGVQPVKMSASPTALAAPHTSPVMFIENTGQWDREVRFQVWGASSGPTWLAEDAIWLTIVQPALAHRDHGAPFGPTSAMADPGALSRNAVAVKLSFIGSNPKPVVEPFGPIDTVVSYFLGNNPANWHPNVPVWGGVRYVDLYPGIDLELVSEGEQMVQKLVARPGADLSPVRLRVEGINGVAIDSAFLRFSTVAGEVVWPLLMTEALDAKVVVQPRGVSMFDVAMPFSSTHAARESVSRLQASAFYSAKLVYGTFVGGSSYDVGYSVVADTSGAVYVTGRTQSSDFPITPGAFDATIGADWDAFVVKLNEFGTDLVYATFLGGSHLDDGYDIAVDASGAAYVTGKTDSSDFPTTPGAFDPDHSATEAFIAKLGQSGTDLVYATFLGGTDNDWGYGIAVDLIGTAYVTGKTGSSDFPTTPDALDTSFNGGIYQDDAFVVKLSPTGSSLGYGTFLGGTAHDRGDHIAVDGSGAAYITGETWSFDFPATQGAFDTTHNGDADAFVARLDSSGSTLVYATFLGGSGNDRGFAVFVDSSSAAYLTGSTFSSNFPTTPGAFDTEPNSIDAFVVKLNGSGTDLAYATFLGGSVNDNGNDITVDSGGSAYIAGWTYASDFPTTPDALDTTHNGDYDGFLAKLSTTGSDLTYSTFLGGSGKDMAEGIAMDSSGAAYVTGETRSASFPTTASAFDTSFNGGADAFVVKLSMGGESGFLDLPFEYPIHDSVALLNWDEEGGRVRSWFDHDWPDFNVTAGNGSFILCSGNDVTGNELYSYDDHNGYDFTATGSDDVYAAADGTVYESRCGGYGNQVVLEHSNGFFTLYGHLQGDSILVTQGEQVTRGQPLGTMGGSKRICDAEGENCYCKQDGYGTHLHFGLYRDNGDGIWREAEVVDPNGWFGPMPDPWVDLGGATSNWLWSFERSIQPAFRGSEGASFTDLGGSITIDIPPGFYEGDVTMELLREPPIAEPSATLKSAGHSFWLRLLELLDSSQADSPSGSSRASAAEVITVTVTYTDAAVMHLDESGLGFERWNESSGTWEPIASTVDSASNIVTAETLEIGHFSLHAPLLCEQDEYLADDSVLGAVVLPIGMTANRLFDMETDEDWFRFEARVGWEYTIQTDNLAANVDTFVEIRDVDETTQLVEDDNSGEGLGSRLVWRAPSNGTYFARIFQSTGSAYGCASSYQISLSRKALVYLPIVLR